LSLATVGVLVGLVQAGLIRVVNPRIGDQKSIYAGLFFYSIGLALFAFATEGWMMFVFLVPYCLGGIAGPSLQSALAKHVPSNEQGELQGALTSLMSLTTVIGPLIMNNLFHYFTTPAAPIYFPGVSFLLASFFMLWSIFIAWKVFTKEKKLRLKEIS
jgi:DHA1 family tetracycline resistance protein-like MFS transporter